MEHELMKTMIRKAKQRHARIFPCGIKSRIEDCFTVFEDHLVLWYNTMDKNTHILIGPRFLRSQKISFTGAR